MGIGFEIDDLRGPIIPEPIQTASQLAKLVPIDLEDLSFIGESLKIIRKEVDDADVAVLGFVGDFQNSRSCLILDHYL